jgi:hypothetical protein
MMNKNYVILNDDRYEIKEPTVSTWMELMKFKDILDEHEMNLKLISLLTGLDLDEIRDCEVREITRVSQILSQYLGQDSKRVKLEIEFKGVKYKLFDTNNMTFGQFVDIDSFLRKDDSYRNQNLNELSAYLYSESGYEYGQTNIKDRIEKFKDLPLSVLESSLFFLLNLGRGSLGLTHLYSKNKLVWMMMRLRVVSHSFGDTIRSLVSWRNRKYGRWILLLILVLCSPLIICLTLWTLIKREKN